MVLAPTAKGTSLKLSISACIPCHNNRDTLPKVIESVRTQTFPVEKTILIDDGSTGHLSDLARKHEVELHRNPTCLGRGYVRAQAVDKSVHDLVLFCDATNVLPKMFLEQALPHFKDKQVAAVSGRIANHSSVRGTAIRWRGRHLFKESHDFGQEPLEAETLTTYGTLMRRRSVLAVGNFDERLRHSEDHELGRRLLQAGYRIIGDPDLVVYSVRPDTCFSVLERFWRWYGGIEERIRFIDYLHSIRTSLNPMIRSDLREGDLGSALLSLFCPHYGYARALIRRLTGKAQTNAMKTRHHAHPV